MFGQQQQQQGNNFIPQIVMNPWDPSQAPVMTLAPLANVANAMQAAYHQQMLLQQQASRHLNNRSCQVFALKIAPIQIRMLTIFELTHEDVCKR